MDLACRLELRAALPTATDGRGPEQASKGPLAPRELQRLAFLIVRCPCKHFQQGLAENWRFPDGISGQAKNGLSAQLHPFA